MKVVKRLHGWEIFKRTKFDIGKGLKESAFKGGLWPKDKAYAPMEKPKRITITLIYEVEEEK